MLPQWLHDKKIGIFGFGVNNAKLTAWLLRHGAAELVVYEEQSARAEAALALCQSRTPQGNRPQPATPQGCSQVRVVSDAGAFERATDREVIFRSAGVHPNHPALVAARARGARISSQSDLFLELCPATTVGITGTKGKGTTASLLVHVLDQRPDPSTSGSAAAASDAQDDNGHGSGVRGQVLLAGNIGRDPFEFLDELTPNDMVVLELSSGQLQDMTRSPQLAVVLDISQDHLDYHASLDEYLDAKKNIVRFQRPGDVALLNRDSQSASSFADVAGGIVLRYSTESDVAAGGFLRGDTVHVRDPRKPEEATVSLAGLRLRGPHNRVNALAAVTAALILGADPQLVEERLATFTGMPHRLEIVPTDDGITWVNDSYGTIQQTVMTAIQSFDGPILLISGGYDKGLDYRELGQLIAKRDLKELLTIGTIGPKIAEAARGAGFPEAKIHEVGRLERAVTEAARQATPGDTVILAPGTSSFDQFKNATERGEAFKRLVSEIREHP